MIALGACGVVLIVVALLLAMGIPHLTTTTKGAAIVGVVAFALGLWGALLLRSAVN